MSWWQRRKLSGYKMSDPDLRDYLAYYVGSDYHLEVKSDSQSWSDWPTTWNYIEITVSKH